MKTGQLKAEEEKNCKSGPLHLTPMDSEAKGVDQAHMNKLDEDKDYANRLQYVWR